MLSIVSSAQITGTLQHNSLTRGYELYIPSGWSAGQSLPLVFVLHGTTQTGNGIMGISDFNSIAEANNFIVAYPDGIGGSWGTGLPGASTADDLGFIDALAADLTSQYGVDTNRVYSCGFSAGGYMSHRLACESARCFAAIGSVAGTMIQNASNNCAPQFTTPVMQIHGTADFVVDYNGGVLAGLGVEQVMMQWNGFNNCATNPVITQLPNTNLLDLSTVEQQVWSPCDQNTSNVLLKINGGGHQWPGTSTLLGGVGTINQDIDASQMLWSFFSNYSCNSNNSTSVNETTISPMLVTYSIAEQMIHVEWFFDAEAYSLVDLYGRSVREGSLKRGDNTISAHGVASGTYLIRTSRGSSSTAIIR